MEAGLALVDESHPGLRPNAGRCRVGVRLAEQKQRNNAVSIDLPDDCFEKDCGANFSKRGHIGFPVGRDRDGEEDVYFQKN